MAFLIPSIFLIIAFIMKTAAGPYWQFPDPCYGNLIASLTLIKLKAPAYISSPGTPQQLLGAFLILLLNIGHSTAETIVRVLSNPEFYLNLMSITMLVMIFTSSLALGLYINRKTRDPLSVLLSQIPVLTFLTLRTFSFYDYVLPLIANVTPEVLMVTVGCLFNLYLLKMYYKDIGPLQAVVMLSFLTGLGMACKITFVPMILVPLIVAKGLHKLLAVLLTAVSFVLWTLPIISFYPKMASWVLSLSTHVGEYGSGAVGFVNIHQYFINWTVMAVKCWPLILLSTLLFSFGRYQDRFTLALTVCILLQVALIAKHYDEHYLASVINVFGALFVIAYEKSKAQNAYFKKAAILGVMAVALYSLTTAVVYASTLSAFTKDAVNFNHQIHNQYPDAMIVGVFPEPMSNPEGAFFMANDWDNNQQQELLKLFPHNMSYFSNNINTHAPYVSGIYTLDRRIWADDLINAKVQTVFIAPKTYDFSQTPYTVLPLAAGKYAGAFLLTASTEKPANEFLEASLVSASHGDYKRAFAFAFKAKELHYQPVQKAEYLMGILYNQLKN